MKSIFTKTPAGIIPNNEESLELFDKVPDGALVSVEYIKRRNYENHKRWFAMAKIFYDMQEQFDNYEIFRKHLIMIAGHFDTVIVEHPKTGEITTQYWPKSLEFSKMDELEFQKMFRRCITGFISRYGKGIKEKELMRIIDFD